MKEKMLRSLCFFTMAWLVICTSVSQVRADTGPKPSITLTIENPPAEEYYVSLLEGSSDATEVKSERKLDNVTRETVETYLENFDENGWGWYFNPVGTRISFTNEEHRYHFGYMVPKYFRVILITKSGDVTISSPHNRMEFNADITYDFQTGEVTERIIDKIAKRGLYMAMCLLTTFVIEFGVFMLFGLARKKRNVICFFVVNTITNVLLSSFMLTANLGPGLFIVGINLEVVIALVEAVAYTSLLTDKKGVSYGIRAFIYGIVANVCSALMAGPLMVWYLELLDL